MENKSGVLRIDLSHLGIMIDSDKIVSAVWNRANKDMQLKWFSPSNLSSAWKSNMKLKDLANPEECVLAFNAWNLIATFHHPQDYGPSVAFQVVLNNHLLKPVRKVQPFIRFFLVMVSENSGRASRSEAPMVYDEAKLKWDAVIQACGDDDEKGCDNKQVVAMKRRITDLEENLRQLSRGSSQGTGGYNKRKKTSVIHCRDYNSANGCQNPESDVGCQKGDRKFHHGCNRKTEDGYCNSKEHNRLGHSD